MLVIEELNVRNKRELNKYEAKYIRELKAELNYAIPQDIEEGLDKKEWKRQYIQKNRGQIAENMKKYYEDNREILLVKYKKYREENHQTIARKKKENIVCGCGSEIRKVCLASHKRSKKHQDWEKGIITTIKGEQVVCECGSEITKAALSRHKKSKKHQNWEKLSETIV